ncbi:unnamed protein product [Rhizophagus irregularis]|nr:unnamed protein product [Rhizophagus irregularis]
MSKPYLASNQPYFEFHDSSRSIVRAASSTRKKYQVLLLENLFYIRFRSIFLRCFLSAANNKLCDAENTINLPNVILM